jgi:8-oxo-dGTP diphosphatase
MNPLLVTAAIIEHEGKILLAQRRADAPYPLLWEFPGGKLEPMEDPRDCVIREVREELAIEVEAGPVYDVVYYRYPERTVLIIVYRCRWLSGEVRDLDVTAHRWAAPEELLTFTLLPADVPLAERLCAEYRDARPSCL